MLITGVFMVAPISHPAWEKLIKGQINHQFSQASAGLLLFNLQQSYKKDPSKLQECIQQAADFFKKYESILIEDSKKIFG